MKRVRPKKIYFDVAGELYETFEETLDRFPGQVEAISNEHEILSEMASRLKNSPYDKFNQ